MVATMQSEIQQGRVVSGHTAQGSFRKGQRWPTPIPLCSGAQKLPSALAVRDLTGDRALPWMLEQPSLQEAEKDTGEGES